MKFVSTMAMGLALAMGGAAVVAVQPAMAQSKKEKAPKGPELGKETRAALVAAQEALAKDDFVTAAAKIAEAEAVAKTPDEKYFTAQLKLNLGSKQKNEAIQASAVDLMIASGGAPADQLPSLYQNQGAFAFRLNQPAKAEAAFSELARLRPNDADTLIMLAEIRNMNKKPAEALQAIEMAVAAKKAAAQPVPEDWYKKAMQIAMETKLSAQSAVWGNGWVAAYPSPETWRAVLQIYQQNTPMDEQTSLDIYRLQRAAKALAGERDFYEYANVAYEKGLPGEAVAVVDEGLAANMLNQGNKAALEIKGLAAQKVPSDKSALPSLDTNARKAASGKAAAGTADAYLSYGQYAKAADLYRVALEKGQVDADTINTRLGIALARSGQKDAAKAALAQVKGPIRSVIAQYWSIWIDQQA